jgi:hypothetical protein
MKIHKDVVVNVIAVISNRATLCRQVDMYSCIIAKHAITFTAYIKETKEIFTILNICYEKSFVKI